MRINKLVNPILLLLLCFVFSTCEEEESRAVNSDFQGLSLVSSQISGLDFRNDLKESKDNNILFYDYYYNGAGVAVADFNNDDLPDLFFTGNTSANALYLNKGELKFENITQKAKINSTNKWSTGVSTVDINRDGFMDIYVCNSGPFKGGYDKSNQLYINNGDLTFTEKAEEYGLASTNRSNQASFFDYDKDGDLDLFLMNNMNSWEDKIKDVVESLEKMNVEDYQKESNQLYRNDDGKFIDITESSGIMKAGYGLGLYTGDITNDGNLEIYVANDYWIPDFLYKYQNGKFADNISSTTKHTSFFGMGVDVGDLTNDGLSEIFVLDMTPGDHIRNKTLMASMNPDRFNYIRYGLNYHPQYMFNSLQLNNGLGLFSEIGLFSGMSQTEWSWSTLFADLDQDGLQDNIITNGFLRDTKDNDWANRSKIIRDSLGKSYDTFWTELMDAKSQPVNNFIFKNLGKGEFEDHSKEWGFNKPSFSNGCIYADLDRDGDLDIVINNINEFAFLYENTINESASANYINFAFTDKGNKERFLNAKVIIHYKDDIQYREIVKTRGYLSSVEPIAYFGIGDEKTIDKVEIKWLNGKVSIIDNPTINKTHKIEYVDHLNMSKIAENKNERGLFVHVEKNILPTGFEHKENSHSDYDREVLIPHSQSYLGPALAYGDVNGDNLEDFFVGGAKGQSAALYLQTKDSKFKLSDPKQWSNELNREDVGALFIDCDNDQDLDLYVASGGGSDFLNKEADLQDRLYVNDGKGNFRLDTKALPNMQTSNGRIKAFDYDKDGDQDLFVCGRTSPGKYPFPTKSYLLQNNKGKFIDVTDTVFPGLNPAGMITDMIWTDQNKDGNIDVMMVGEWSSIRLFHYDGKLFKEVSEELGLNNTNGWWYSIAQNDIDNDGDQDYIVGNLGLNNKFHPHEEKPFHVYCNDFDENGTFDIVLSKKYKGNYVPVRGKECSTEQMPFLSEKFPTYLEFASASLEEIYSEDKLQDALHYEVSSFESILLINEGNELKIKPLPIECQYAPINSILTKDFDKDGHTDLVIAGNNYTTEVETPAYDAGKGLFLRGLGNGNFEVVPLIESGLVLPYNLKEMVTFEFKYNGKIFPIIIAANNDGPIQILGFRG